MRCKLCGREILEEERKLVGAVLERLKVYEDELKNFHQFIESFLQVDAKPDEICTLCYLTLLEAMISMFKVILLKLSREGFRKKLQDIITAIKQPKGEKTRSATSAKPKATSTGTVHRTAPFKEHSTTLRDGSVITDSRRPSPQWD